MNILNTLKKFDKALNIILCLLLAIIVAKVIFEKTYNNKKNISNIKNSAE